MKQPPSSTCHDVRRAGHALSAESLLDVLKATSTGGWRRLKPGTSWCATASVACRKPSDAARVRFALQFYDSLIYVLLASGLITLALADYVGTAVIFGGVLINAVIVFVQEGKAEAALEAVRAMLASRAWVVRNGERHEIDAEALAPGDIVLESGVRVPVDLRLVRIKNLRIDEAALTGGSLPVERGAAAAREAAALADRTGMAYSGTGVSYRNATGVVAATGAATEIGRIGTLVSEVQSLTTPLTRRLDPFARRITAFILALGGLTFIVFEWELSRGASLEITRTAAVNRLVVGERVYLFNVRHFTASSLTRDILVANPVALWMSVALIALQLMHT